MEGLTRTRVNATTKAAPAALTREPLVIREELLWDPERVRAYPWLAEYADVPEDASPPAAMTYPTEEAVCSYGWHGCTHLDGAEPVIPWAERELDMTLRWWQRLAIIRQHEHRADGTLIWTTDVESASRRSGKSHRLRAVAAWRLSNAAVIGELQAVVHCGNDLAVCRDVQKKAWRWAMGKWGKSAVTMGNGKELVENPHDGSTWVVKAQDAAYGIDANLAMVDEGWDVKPDTVDEGLEPMLVDRLWAQLLITSTAHRRARSTMKTRIVQTLAEDDGETLLLWWGALPQDDPGLESTWRKASPHWTEHRRKMIAKKYEKALAGEEDPQADDPDPMEGFRAQYLNTWLLTTAGRTRGEPVVDKAAWGELAVPVPTRAPDGAAIESHFDAGLTVAVAWRLPDGAALVRTVPADDLTEAGLVVVTSGYGGVVTLGASLMDDPAAKTMRVAKGSGRGIGAVVELSRLMAEGQWAHDGSDHLTKQVLAARTVTGADGPRLASHGRADAIKAAVWAAGVARSSKPARKGPLRVLMPSV